MKKQIVLFSIACALFVEGYSQAPSITSFTPASGPVGTLVTIAGINLSSPTAFTIGGVSAIVVSDIGDTLVGMVMPGAVTGAVSVTTAGGTATSTGSYTVASAPYQGQQQGPKLFGTGSIGPEVFQGCAVSMSADGNTAIVGGYGDSSTTGAVWVYTRSAGIWTQQGNKLVGTGAANQYGGFGAQQGYSVALSADGNTLIEGANWDGFSFGALWVFTRSAGVWAQQGGKLVGTGVDTSAFLGSSVAISADGNTAVTGGPYDSAGAVWVFTRSGGTWTQQGGKLAGTGAAGSASQGYSVSISADGNTIIEGGPNDSANRGAAWVFKRTGGIWTQSGSKLSGTGAAGAAEQGTSVAISADGNTAILGGPNDTRDTGAAWIFIYAGGIWTQQGSKMAGTGGVGAAEQGVSVSLSADGNTALVGGSQDNSRAGAIWVYTRLGSSWVQQGNKLLGSGASRPAEQGTSVALSADGTTGIEGGVFDGGDWGAAWIFASCSDTSVTNLSICANALPIIWNGLTFDSAGSQTAHLTNSRGCDSAATLNLTVTPVYTDTLYDSFCAGASFVFAGQSLTQSGTYSDTLFYAGGCDTIITLILTVYPMYNDTLYDSICSGTTFTFAGRSLTQSGAYSGTLTSVNGCDSILALFLTVSPLPSVTLNWQALVQDRDLLVLSPDTLWCNELAPIFAMSGGSPSGGRYYGTYIVDDTFNASFTIFTLDTINYIYTDSNGCTANAQDFFLVTDCDGIQNIPSPTLIRLYPNPNSGSFTLETSSPQGSSYAISNMLGQTIIQQLITSDRQTVEMEAASAGIYTLAISGVEGMAKFAVLR